MQLTMTCKDGKRRTFAANPRKKQTEGEQLAEFWEKNRKRRKKRENEQAEKNS